MSLLSKLLGKKEPVTRVRVCSECGMPVAEHMEWCAILKGQQALDQKAAAAAGD